MWFVYWSIHHLFIRSMGTTVPNPPLPDHTDSLFHDYKVPLFPNWTGEGNPGMSWKILHILFGLKVSLAETLPKSLQKTCLTDAPTTLAHSSWITPAFFKMCDCSCRKILSHCIVLFFFCYSWRNVTFRIANKLSALPLPASFTPYLLPHLNSDLYQSALFL